MIYSRGQTHTPTRLPKPVTKGVCRCGEGRSLGKGGSERVTDLCDNQPGWHARYLVLGGVGEAECCYDFMCVCLFVLLP